MAAVRCNVNSFTLQLPTTCPNWAIASAPKRDVIGIVSGANVAGPRGRRECWVAVIAGATTRPPAETSRAAPAIAGGSEHRDRMTGSCRSEPALNGM
jgi:hypothetical protein